MKFEAPTMAAPRLLQIAAFATSALAIPLHSLSKDPSHLTLIPLFMKHKTLLIALLFCALISVFLRFLSLPRPVFLLDYSCYRPPSEHRLSYEVCEYFTLKSNRFNKESENFMRGIYLKSGLGDETYGPPFIFKDIDANLSSAIEEAQNGVFSAVDKLLRKTHLSTGQIHALIVTSGVFTHSPSLSSMIVNRFSLNPNLKTYNLSGMGCSSGAGAIDLAARILSGSSRKIKNILVVITESTSLNWYFGDDRSMLVTNCIFRVGSAAAIVSSDRARKKYAKLELIRSLRTHTGKDDDAYRAAYQEEDGKGNLGIGLKKDLIRVAGLGLRKHIRELAPRVLPVSELINALAKGYVPDFRVAFEHICLHTGGKAVVEAVAKMMRLPEEVTEPARMTLHRFGNTSSSLVFYELGYYDAKGRLKEGDRVWMIAFGTGFKVCSLVWKVLRETAMQDDNPWKDCIHRYPLKAW